MNYIVFYDYGYYEDDHAGSEFFETLREALSFIEERLKNHDEAKIKDFALYEIKKKLEIVPIKTVTKIGIRH